MLQSEIRIGNRLVGSLKVSYLDKHPNTGKEPFLHEEKDLVGIVASRLSRVIAHRELEIALQRERDFSSTILSTLDSLVVVLDREGRIATFNRACESLTGYLETEVKGRFFEEMLLLAEEVEKVRTVHEALLAGHAPLRFRSHWRTRRGDIRLIEWSNTVLRDSSGMITHVIGTGIDVTDLRKMV